MFPMNHLHSKDINIDTRNYSTISGKLGIVLSYVTVRIHLYRDTRLLSMRTASFEAKAAFQALIVTSFNIIHSKTIIHVRRFVYFKWGLVYFRLSGISFIYVIRLSGDWE